jgi:DNA-binding CsgD family transcriptional regulator
MREVEPILSLVGDIYDAALEPARWGDVLGKARDFVGGCAAVLYSKDASRKNANIYHDDGGIDPHYKQLYLDQYVPLDPTSTAEFFVEIEQPAATSDLISYDEFLQTRHYQEWARPQRLVDHLRAAIDKSATSIAFFGVFLDDRQGLVDDDSRRRMRQIVPHIRRAMLVGGMLERKAAEAAVLADTLDDVSAGIFLVDQSGRIVHANTNGRAMLEERCVLRTASGGRLAAQEANATLALNGVLAVAANGDGAVGRKGIAMPLAARDGDHYVAHALPLLAGERRRAGASYAAVAALFVHKARMEAPAAPEVIAKTYKLTPMELRVLLAIVEVGGVSEVAESLGIGEATVKTHLHRLFGKTDTSRQADLVKLVAGFSTRLVA